MTEGLGSEIDADAHASMMWYVMMWYPATNISNTRNVITLLVCTHLNRMTQNYYGRDANEHPIARFLL